MKNLVRGSVILSIISVFVVFIYAQTTETVSDIAKDSQIENNNKAVTKAENLTETNIEPTVVEVDKKGKIKDPTQDPVKKTEDSKIDNTATAESKDTADDKKLVTKTASSRAVSGVSRGKFVATAYCLRGRTASGAMVRQGIIAADPRVLKLGSRVNLGAGNYTGNYLVADTGGKIKGNRIDIWMASCAEARRFGRRTVTVYTP